MRALITGGYGFVGRHLAQHLVKCGDDVAVTYNPEEKHLINEKFQTPLPNAAQTLALDVRDKKAVNEVMQLLAPDVVYHLAAKSFVPEGESNPEIVFNVNFFGTVNVLDAIKTHSAKSRFLYVSSAEVYGDPRPGSLPLNENAVLRPVSFYGVTKTSADLITFKYSFRDGLDTVRVRPFPHIGPGQSEMFSIASFAKQVAEIKLGRREAVIKVGNLEAKRDFSDVSDIVRGYRELMLNGKKGDVYNLASGTSIAVGDLLKQLITVAEVEAEIEVDPERVRPIDIADLSGNAQKAQKELGWKPRVDLDGTLHSLLAFWLEALS